jgi:hypothetical protein
VQVSSATAASIAVATFAIRAIFAAGIRSGAAPISCKNYFCGFYRLGGAVGSGLHRAPLGIVGEMRKDASMGFFNNSNRRSAEGPPQYGCE